MHTFSKLLLATGMFLLVPAAYPQGTAFAAGERLHYRPRWGLVNAGSFTAELIRIESGATATSSTAVEEEE